MWPSSAFKTPLENSREPDHFEAAWIISSSLPQGPGHAQEAGGAAAMPGDTAGGRPRDPAGTTFPNRNWAMLSQRVCEVDPRECPKRAGAMKVLCFDASF
jgi:hypothetical protein